MRTSASADVVIWPKTVKTQAQLRLVEQKIAGALERDPDFNNGIEVEEVVSYFADRPEDVYEAKATDTEGEIGGTVMVDGEVDLTLSQRLVAIVQQVYQDCYFLVAKGVGLA